MKQDLHPLVGHSLNQNEKVLWSGRPRQGFEFNSYVIFSSLTGLIPFAFISVFAVAFITDGKDIWVGLLMAVGAVLVLASPFYRNKWEREGYWYAVTDQRILLVKDSSRPKLSWIELDRIKDIKFKESRNGNGKILITKSHSYNEYCNFLYLSEARKVFDVINNAIINFKQHQTAD